MKSFTNFNQTMEIKSLLLIILLISITLALYGRKLEANAQETKGGGGGGGGSSFSSFKQSIASFKQKNLSPQITNNAIQTISSTSSLSKTNNRPKPILTSSLNKVSSIEETSSQQQQTESGDSEPAIYGSVSGVPGIDFPGYTSIPNLPFTCEGRPFDPGMYADESTGCQVYHLCYQGRRESFLCGIGTVFNQAILNCDFWHSVECSRSSEFYHLNADFGKSIGEPGGNTQLQQPQQQTTSLVNILKKQQSLSVLRPPNPNPNFKRVESISEFSSRTGGDSLVGGIKSAIDSSFVSNGKTSARREDQFSSSSGLISPSRRAQLGIKTFSSATDSSSLDTTGQQSEMSMSMVNDKGGDISGTIGTPLTVLNGEVNTLTMSQPQTNEIVFGDKKGNSLSKATKSSSSSSFVTSNFATKKGPSKDQGTEADWRPYYKSKEGSSLRPLVPTSSTTTTTTTTSAPTISSTATTQADQEPVFSSNNNSNTSNDNNNNNNNKDEEVPQVPKSSSPPPLLAGDNMSTVDSDSNTSADSVEVNNNRSATNTTPTPHDTGSSQESSNSVPESSTIAPSDGASTSSDSSGESERAAREVRPGVEYENAKSTTKRKA